MRALLPVAHVLLVTQALRTLGPLVWSSPETLAWAGACLTGLLALLLALSHTSMALLLLIAQGMRQWIGMVSELSGALTCVAGLSLLLLLAYARQLARPCVPLVAWRPVEAGRTLRAMLLTGAAAGALPLYFTVGAPLLGILLLTWGALLWASVPRTEPLVRVLAGQLGRGAVLGVVTLLLLECGGRMVFNAPPPGKLFEPHPNRVVTLRPDSTQQVLLPGTPPVYFPVSISAQGLRDREFAAKQEGERRYIALGDSITFGWGLPVEESFPKQLERAYKAAGENVSVVNAGIPGYGPWQSLAWLAEEGAAYQPDGVVFCLFPANDTSNELDRVGRRLRSYNPVMAAEWWRLENAMLAPMRVDRWLRDSSRLYQALTRLGDSGMGPAAHLGLRLRWLQLTQAPWRPPTESGYPSLELCREQSYASLDVAIRLTVGSVREMKAHCDARGWDFLVAVVPSHFAISKPHYDAARARSGMAVYPYEAHRETRIFEAALAAEGIACLSMTDEFLSHPDTSVFYIPKDGHLSSLGNRRLAERAHEALAAAGQ